MTNWVWLIWKVQYSVSDFFFLISFLPEKTQSFEFEEKVLAFTSFLFYFLRTSLWFMTLLIMMFVGFGGLITDFSHLLCFVLRFRDRNLIPRRWYVSSVLLYKQLFSGHTNRPLWLWVPYFCAFLSFFASGVNLMWWNYIDLLHFRYHKFICHFYGELLIMILFT